jgi:hypothetical protein
MKIKMVVAVVAVLGVTGAFAPMASAATCGQQTSQVRDTSGSPDPSASNYNPHYGQPTGADTLGTLPDGGVVYGDASQSPQYAGYIGISGPKGFLDVSGSQSSGITVQGSQPDSGVFGKATVGTSPSACVNGTTVPLAAKSAKARRAHRAARAH